MSFTLDAEFAREVLGCNVVEPDNKYGNYLCNCPDNTDPNLLTLHRYGLWEPHVTGVEYIEQFSYNERKFFSIVEFLGKQGWEVEVSYMNPNYTVIVRRYGIIKVSTSDLPSLALGVPSLAADRA